MTILEAVQSLAASYDRLSGKPGEADRLMRIAMSSGKASRIDALATAFSALSADAAPRPATPGPASMPAATPPERWNSQVPGGLLRTLADHTKPGSALAKYEELLSQGESRKAGQWYSDHREEIVRDVADRAQAFNRMLAEPVEALKE